MSEIETPLGSFKTSLKAARRVNGVGGFQEVLRRIAAFDLDTYVVVAAAGLDKKPNEIEDDVYDKGMPELVESFSDYIGRLANGGRPLKAAAEDATSGKA